MSATGSLTRNLVARTEEYRPVAVPAEPGDVYFIGYPGWLFRFFAPRIFHAFGGRVAGVISDTFVRDHSHMLLWGQPCPLVTLQDALRRAESEPLTFVQFFETPDQFWALAGIERSANVQVTDFLEALDRLGLPHTYVPVREEREWWARQSRERMECVAARFTDDRSRRTLAAKCAALATGDRRALFAVAIGTEHQYFNTMSSQWSLTPGTDAIYVDVGAAGGDTVEKFMSVVGGQFQAIEAFEPTETQFADLQRLASADPRIRVHQAAVGESSGSIGFFENTNNPFGSNAITLGETDTPRQVSCVRLDDVVEHCTLLKMDVEGFECRVLRGAERLIRASRPDLAVTCYHYPQDMFEILDTVLTMHDYRYVALRHFGLSLYDTTLFFSDHQSFA
ncbi:MAG: FkbM family methyltransferase [Gemmatimonas sp.]|jgi:FkbM family methyltransferase|nr:FkbM family methyltransferase [Gemmatimonas sp.]